MSTPSVDIKRHDNLEELVGEQVLLEYGIRVEPYWMTEGDIEGDQYHEYLDQHTDFELQVRMSVAERLKDVQSTLPDSWQLVIKAGYRPLAIQQNVFDAFVRQVSERHTELSPAEVYDFASKYVIDPAQRQAPHSTGGAVDVTLYDTSAGAYVDFGSSLNAIGEISHLTTNLIKPHHAENRKQLLTAMTDAGFAPYTYEWWHFSYGDVIWAIHYGKDSTLYDTLQ